MDLQRKTHTEGVFKLTCTWITWHSRRRSKCLNPYVCSLKAVHWWTIFQLFSNVFEVLVKVQGEWPEVQMQLKREETVWRPHCRKCRILTLRMSEYVKGKGRHHIVTTSYKSCYTFYPYSVLLCRFFLWFNGNILDIFYMYSLFITYLAKDCLMFWMYPTHFT